MSGAVARPGAASTAEVGTQPVLTDQERAELQRCETVIERGRRTFVEVGEALLKVRDARLYRETHPSFEAYLRERWELDRGWAYQLIAASEVVADLSQMSAIVDTAEGPDGRPAPAPPALPLPTNELQTRPLRPLAADERRQAWREAVQAAPGGRPPGAHVKEAVKRLKGDGRARNGRAANGKTPASSPNGESKGGVPESRQAAVIARALTPSRPAPAAVTPQRERVLQELLDAKVLPDLMEALTEASEAGYLPARLLLRGSVVETLRALAAYFRHQAKAARAQREAGNGKGR